LFYVVTRALGERLRRQVPEQTGPGLAPAE
jgi:hypothetical protein